MPIESKKQSVAKQNWLKENSKIFAIRVMKNSEQGLFEFLSSQNEPSKVIKTAIYEYMDNHKGETE